MVDRLRGGQLRTRQEPGEPGHVEQQATPVRAGDSPLHPSSGSRSGRAAVKAEVPRRQEDLALLAVDRDHESLDLRPDQPLQVVARRRRKIAPAHEADEVRRQLDRDAGTGGADDPSAHRRVGAHRPLVGFPRAGAATVEQAGKRREQAMVPGTSGRYSLVSDRLRAPTGSREPPADRACPAGGPSRRRRSRRARSRPPPGARAAYRPRRRRRAGSAGRGRRRRPRSSRRSP